MGIFDMLSRMLKGDHTPIFSFLLIFSDLCPILTGLVCVYKFACSSWSVDRHRDCVCGPSESERTDLWRATAVVDVSHCTTAHCSFYFDAE